MKVFDRDEFIDFILDNDVVGFFDRPVTLKSGRESHWYVNWRTITGDVFLAERLAEYLISFIADCGIGFDIIYGVPDGATRLGIVAQYLWARGEPSYGKGSHTLLMGRGAPKQHGVAKDRSFLGEPRGRIVVVEDVTTTGSSLIAAIGSLREAGAEVIAAVGLTDRMERRDDDIDDDISVADAVADLGVPYHAMSEAHELLPRIIARADPGDRVKKAIQDEFERYGVKPLNLI